MKRLRPPWISGILRPMMKAAVWEKLFILGGIVMAAWLVLDALSYSPPVPGVHQATDSGAQIPSRTPSGINTLFSGEETALRSPAASGSGSPPWISDRYEIELKGTVSGAAAIVRDMASASELIVHIGDLVNGGKVTDIQRNRITLSGDAGTDTLELPVHPEASPAVSNEAAGEIPKSLSRTALRRLSENIDSLSREVSLNAVRDARGQLMGFKVTALQPGGLLEQMGFQTGDIILRVNSQKITSPGDVYRILEDARHGNILKIKIRRNARDVEMAFRIY